MIRCNIDGHDIIFCNFFDYAEHILDEHPHHELAEWAKENRRKEALDN